MGRPYDESALAGFGRLGFPAVIPNYPPAVFPSFFSNCRRSYAPHRRQIGKSQLGRRVTCSTHSRPFGQAYGLTCHTTASPPKLLTLTCPSPSVDWEESVRPSRDMLDTLKAVRPSLRSHMPHDGLPSQTVDAHMPFTVGRLGRVRMPKELRLPDELNRQADSPVDCP